MAHRSTIADVAGEAGVSVATVDRVLNGRHPVREETAARVLKAAERLGFHGVGAMRQRLRPDAPRRTLAFVLQKPDQPFYQALDGALREETRKRADIRGRALVEFADDLSPAAIVTALERVEKADAIALVAPDHPAVGAAVRRVAEAGKPVHALLTPLTEGGSVGYVGIDNRRAGRMAAWLIARTARAPGPVGLIVGSHRYLGHEMREIGFRSYFREHAPEFRVLDALVNLEEPRISHEATLELFKRHPDLAGLCVAGGGMEGVLDALRQEGRTGALPVVVNELTDDTRRALIDDVVTMVIATPIEALAARAVEAMVDAMPTGGAGARGGEQAYLPFAIATSENV